MNRSAIARACASFMRQYFPEVPLNTALCMTIGYAVGMQRGASDGFDWRYVITFAAVGIGLYLAGAIGRRLYLRRGRAHVIIDFEADAGSVIRALAQAQRTVERVTWIAGESANAKIVKRNEP